MPDNKYCYPDTTVLINKLNIKDANQLFEAEKELTSIRLRELQEAPIKGKFDFNHLKAIHKYIFQDLYSWAGQERTVEIGKGNLFCIVACIQDYATSVFDKYYSQCYDSKNNFSDFVRNFAENYGDLNALHPFREGNGRTQREFARLVCLDCGYNFDLSCTTHKQMLEASQLSFNKGDSSGFIKIFSDALTPYDEQKIDVDKLNILTTDDLVIGPSSDYDYYKYGEYENSDIYEEIYKAKIEKMDAEKIISDARSSLIKNQEVIENQAQELKRKSRQIVHDELER